MFMTSRFQMYDFGDEKENLRHYGQVDSPYTSVTCCEDVRIRTLNINIMFIIVNIIKIFFYIDNLMLM